MDQETKAWDRFGKFILIMVAIIGAALILTGNPVGWSVFWIDVGVIIFFTLYRLFHIWVALFYRR